jgi:hypothetical protein
MGCIFIGATVAGIGATGAAGVVLVDVPDGGGVDDIITYSLIR